MVMGSGLDIGHGAGVGQHRAEAILASLRDAELELQAMAGLDGGSLRLAAFASASATIVPLAVARFRERHPAVGLSIVMADPAQSLPGIRSGELDLALSHDPVEHTRHSQLFLRACHEAGFEPRIAFQNDDYTAILGFVAAGVGVALLPDMVCRAVRDDVVVRELDPAPPPRPISAALPEGYRSPAAAAMLSVLLEVAQEWVAAQSVTQAPASSPA